MSDHITLELNALAWEPSEDSTMVRELDNWNRPTLGILEQHGAYFLFEAFINDDAGPTLWVYSPIDEYELGQYDGADAETILRLVNDHQSNRNLTLAMTDDDSHILVGRGLPASEVPLDIEERRAVFLDRMGEHVNQVLNEAKAQVEEGERPSTNPELYLRLIPN